MQYIEELKKLGIAFGYFLASLLLFLLLFTTLYYFNWIGNKTWTVIELMIPFLSTFIGGIQIGRKAKKKGWLSGLKLSVVIILFFILFTLACSRSFVLQTLIYYVIIVCVTLFGSMLGINFKKSES